MHFTLITGRHGVRNEERREWFIHRRGVETSPMGRLSLHGSKGAAGKRSCLGGMDNPRTSVRMLNL